MKHLPNDFMFSPLSDVMGPQGRSMLKNYLPRLTVGGTRRACRRLLASRVWHTPAQILPYAREATAL